MNRIVIVGTTGSGKTTLGQKLSERCGLPFVDLDALYWEADWKEAPFDVFIRRVAKVVAGEKWVIAGNYSKVRDLIWPEADTVVWLDYPLSISLWRLFRRTVRRIVTREDLWNTGNRETWRKQFFSRESLFLWAIESHSRRKRKYPQIFLQPEYSHINIIHLRSPRKADQWLSELKNAQENLIG